MGSILATFVPGLVLVLGVLAITVNWRYGVAAIALIFATDMWFRIQLEKYKRKEKYDNQST